jgi:hypothetical protein
MGWAYLHVWLVITQGRIGDQNPLAFGDYAAVSAL